MTQNTYTIRDAHNADHNNNNTHDASMVREGSKDVRGSGPNHLDCDDNNTCGARVMWGNHEIDSSVPSSRALAKVSYGQTVGLGVGSSPIHVRRNQLALNDDGIVHSPIHSNPPTYPTIHPSTLTSIRPLAHPPTHPPTHPSIHPPIYSSAYPSIQLPTYPSRWISR